MKHKGRILYIFMPLTILTYGNCEKHTVTEDIVNEDATEPNTGSKPNVIIIMTDDLGYGDVSFHSCKEFQTPVLDQIARNGVVFTDGYVTSPQCAPSRAGFMSGRYQNSFGRAINDQLTEMGMPEGLMLFGNYMREAGYKTGMVGKWHLGDMEGSHPLERGFDSFFGFLRGSSFYFPPEGQMYIPRILDGRTPAQVKNYLTHEFGDQAVKFVRENHDGPFFLFLSFNAPHTPMQAPANYIDSLLHIGDETRRIYAAMVTAMDDNIGKVMSALEELDIEENTLVIFLSDNGGPTNENKADNTPLRGVKGDILEGGVRVPFILQWKGTVPSGQVIDVPVSSLDLIPTALAVAGVNPAKYPDLDGLNILPLVKGEGSLPDRVITWSFPFPPRQPHRHTWGIRHKDWKLVKEAFRVDGIGGYTGGTKTGLYNIIEDKSELNDLSEQQADKRQELQQLFDSWESNL